MKNNSVNLKIIDIELGLATCSSDMIPSEWENGKTVVFFYLEKRDFIIFNEEHPDCGLLLDFFQVYLNSDSKVKAEMLGALNSRGNMEYISSLIEAMNRILKTRRRLYGGAA